MTTVKWFWSLFVPYLFLYLGNRLGYVFHWLIQFYLADLLAIPIMATLSLWSMRYLLQQPSLTLKAWHLIITVVLCSLVFELCLPRMMTRYHSDPIDILMYIMGAAFFWKAMNK